MAEKKDQRLSIDQVEKAQEAIRYLSSLSQAGPSGTSSGDGASRPRSTSVVVEEEDLSDDGSHHIQDRCSSAVSTLRRVRASLSGGSTGRAFQSSAIGKGFKASFLGKKKKLLPPPPKRGRWSWTHRFMCLSRCDQEAMPTTDREKDALLEAGLGEKSVTIPDIDATAEEFRAIMLKEYPKLKDAGGFLFGKGKTGGRDIEILSSLCLTSPRILRDRVGNTRTYIVPLQRDLSMSAVCQLPDGPVEKCLSCCREIPITELSSHLSHCSEDQSASDKDPIHSDSSSELPRVSVRSKTPPIFTDSDTDSEDEAILKQVLEESRREASKGKRRAPSNNSLASVVKDIASAVQEYDEFVFEVRRDNILADCLEQVDSQDFSPTKSIEVVFLCENGKDGGGLRREMWRLFGIALRSSSYLDGFDHNLVIRHDMLALQSNTFRKLGVLMATAIAQGGSGFPFLNEGVYQYLCGMDPAAITLSDEAIPDYDVQGKVKKIKEAVTVDELKDVLVDASDILVDCGFVKAPTAVTLRDRSAIIQAITMHYIIYHSMAELDQLRSGLHTLGVANAMHLHPDLFKPLFVLCDPSKLTLATMKNLFLGRVMFSASGSNKRQQEMAVYINFKKYLEECAVDGSEVSLEDVLAFFSGAPNIPPLGFEPQPNLYFGHENLYPKASTCSFGLILPCLTGYDVFKANMTTGVKEHGGFGEL